MSAAIRERFHQLLNWEASTCEDASIKTAILAARDAFDASLAASDKKESFLALKARFRRLFPNASSFEAEDECAALLERWDAPHRKYHTRQHLLECLAELDAVRESLSAEAAQAIELALWFHDAIYGLHSGDNEEQSAALCRRKATLLCDEHLGIWAASMILATTHNNAKQAFLKSQSLMLDIDLGILSADPARFDEYERQIREEFSFVEEATFRFRRIEILERLGGAEFSYRSKQFQHRNERARENLKRSIARLKGR